MENREKAAKVYEIIQSVAGGNAIAQGLSGIFGCGINWMVDIAAIPFHYKMYSDIADVYGQSAMSLESAFTFMRPNIPYILEDIVFDKLAASIPIVGIPLNVAFAKGSTWRIGAWFGLLSALGEDVSQKVMVRSTMELVREFFPIEDMLDVWGMFTFRFNEPDKERFIAFLSSLEGLTSEEVDERISSALDALRGPEYDQEETEDSFDMGEDDGDVDASAIWLPVPAPIPGGGAATATTTESPLESPEYQSGLFPAMKDAVGADQKPRMLFLPAISSFHDREQTDNSHHAKTPMQEGGSQPKPPVSGIKRNHGKTGKPKGRPPAGTKSENR